MSLMRDGGRRDDEDGKGKKKLTTLEFFCKSILSLNTKFRGI